MFQLDAEGRMDDELLGRQSAFDEAKALYGMIGNDSTVEELRELIAVPAKIELALREFAKANPHEAYWIEWSLKFRSRVLEEFDRLVREGLLVADSPEVQACASAPSVEALAFAPA